MTAADLTLREAPAAPAFAPALPEVSVGRRDRIESLLGLGSTAALILGDVAIVYAAFLIAHWMRFVAPDAVGQAMGLEQYARHGLIVGMITAGLFMLHGLYDAERPRAWPARVHLVISSLSTALLLAITFSFYAGEARFSRIWVAGGWTIATVALLAWRAAANRIYVLVRDALLPHDHVLIVGANALGAQIASELTGRYRVVGTFSGPRGAKAMEMMVESPLGHTALIVVTFSAKKQDFGEGWHDLIANVVPFRDPEGDDDGPVRAAHAWLLTPPLATA